LAFDDLVQDDDHDLAAGVEGHEAKHRAPSAVDPHLSGAAGAEDGTSEGQQPSDDVSRESATHNIDPALA
jgi:hypothetical protein